MYHKFRLRIGIEEATISFLKSATMGGMNNFSLRILTGSLVMLAVAGVLLILLLAGLLGVSVVGIFVDFESEIISIPTALLYIPVGVGVILLAIGSVYALGSFFARWFE